MTEVESKYLNYLAWKYVQGDLDVAYDVVQVLEPIIKREARKWGNHYERGETCNFESYFREAVWEALDGYDGRSDFIQRYYTFLKATGSRWKDKLKTQKRMINQLLESLDQELDSAGSSETRITQIPAPNNTEDEVILKEKIASFLGEADDLTGKIIYLFLAGYDPHAIAKKLGASSYDAKTRKQVERAKNRFTRYLLDY